MNTSVQNFHIKDTTIKLQENIIWEIRDSFEWNSFELNAELH